MGEGRFLNVFFFFFSFFGYQSHFGDGWLGSEPERRRMRRGERERERHAERDVRGLSNVMNLAVLFRREG